MSLKNKKLSLAPTQTMLKKKKKIKSGNIPLAPHFQKLVTDEEQGKSSDFVRPLRGQEQDFFRLNLNKYQKSRSLRLH